MRAAFSDRLRATARARCSSRQLVKRRPTSPATQPAVTLPAADTPRRATPQAASARARRSTRHSACLTATAAAAGPDAGPGPTSSRPACPAAHRSRGRSCRAVALPEPFPGRPAPEHHRQPIPRQAGLPASSHRRRFQRVRRRPSLPDVPEDRLDRPRPAIDQDVTHRHDRSTTTPSVLATEFLTTTHGQEVTKFFGKGERMTPSFLADDRFQSSAEGAVFAGQGRFGHTSQDPRAVVGQRTSP